MENVAWVGGAFILFAIALPLFGFLAGVLARLCFPYLLGLLAFLLPIQIDFAIGITCMWLLAMICSRFLVNKEHKKNLAWHEGHYRAVAQLATVGRVF